MLVSQSRSAEPLEGILKLCSNSKREQTAQESHLTIWSSSRLFISMLLTVFRFICTQKFLYPCFILYFLSCPQLDWFCHPNWWKSFIPQRDWSLTSPSCWLRVCLTVNSEKSQSALLAVKCADFCHKQRNNLYVIKNEHI